jgi:hypothetical protein
MAEDADDAYLEASWADPRALKRELHGTGSVGLRGARGPPVRGRL